MDDSLIASPGQHATVITELAQQLQVEDRGLIADKPESFNGMEIQLVGDDGYFVHQYTRIMDYLQTFGMLDCEPAPTPMLVEHGLDWRENAPPPLRGELEHLRGTFGTPAKAVGDLIFITQTCRPDVRHAVAKIGSRQDPTCVYFYRAVRHLWRYLKGAADWGILYRFNRTSDRESFHNQTVVYTDADWAADSRDRKSYSGILVFVAGNLVAWSSRKQSMVATSTAYAEVAAMSEGLERAIEVDQLARSQTGHIYAKPPVIIMKQDNKTAKTMSENYRCTRKTRSQDVKYYNVRNHVETRRVQIDYVPSEDQLADILTKPLTTTRFRMLRSKIMCSLSSLNVKPLWVKPDAGSRGGCQTKV